MQSLQSLQRLLGTFIFLLALLVGGMGHAIGKEALHAVKKVIDGDTVILDSGEHVRLVGIQAPEIARDDSSGQPYGPEATETLKKLIGNQKIRLEMAEEPRDRHGRILAYLYPQNGNGEGEMLQIGMLKAGAAMLYTFPANTVHVEAFRKAENNARASQKGLWQLASYKALTAENADQGMGQYRVVEGTIRQVAKVRGSWYLNFGENWKEDFTLFIERKHLKRFSSGDMHPQGWEGRKIRIHGWIFPKNGPMIQLTHPQQIELLVSGAGPS
jgi:endonuclease YncB( thermonuclease family)